MRLLASAVDQLNRSSATLRATADLRIVQDLCHSRYEQTPCPLLNILSQQGHNVRYVSVGTLRLQKVQLLPGVFGRIVTGDPVIVDENDLTFTQIQVARDRLEGIAFHTANFRSRQFDTESGCCCFFKAENMQRTGSIKFRGVFNKLKSALEARTINRVITKGSEDLSLAAALSANLLGFSAVLILPDITPQHALSAANSYGAQILLYETRGSKGAEILRKLTITSEDLLLSDPEDSSFGAGEATAVLEMIEDVPDLDCLILPDTEPSLLRFFSELNRFSSRQISLYAAINNRETAYFRMPEGLIEILNVTEEQNTQTQFFLLQRMKILVNSHSCSVAAAVLSNPDLFAGKRVGLILGSGNVDLNGLGCKFQESQPFYENNTTEYLADCYTCRKIFNAAESIWCDCLSPQRTLVCPTCLSCFCGAPKEYHQKFWENAPQGLWDRMSKERRDHATPIWNPPTSQVRRPLVLIVEPDLHIQRMAKRIAEGLGYGVILAADGHTGLENAKRYLPDFVLTAALMPRLDGREMCRQIKESPETGSVKVAVMTALYTQQKYRSEAFRKFHADEYVSKPLKMADLQALLRKYLDAHL